MTVSDYNKSVEELADKLYRFALKTLNDDHAANDVVQDSFERLWIKHESVNANKVKSYLFTTAYHACIDIIRSRKKEAPFESVTQSNYSVSNEYFDLQEILHEALKRLPEIQRSVILLRDYEGYTYNEIQEITGLSEAQVKVYIYRGRMILKDYIKTPQTII